jgi:hypothetical protein
MNDLTDRLARLDATASAPSEDMVAGDLARAHHALGRRRRTRAALAGTGLTLGLGAALGVVVAVNGGGDAAPPVSGPSSSDPGRQQSGGVDLVAYTGAQPEGFLLGKVPEGYQVQGSDAFVLTLATPGDHSHYLNFEGKLVIMLESQDASQQLGEGEHVSVNGEPGVLQGGSGEPRTLRYTQGEHLVLVQAWENIGLTDDQLVELAESITVTSAVEAGVG